MTEEPSLSITRNQLFTGEPRTSHAAHADRMGEHAVEQLENGDLLQASEKAWRAAVHELARIARQNGGRLDSHRQVKNFVSQLSVKHNDRRLWLLASAVENAHTNFYKDTMTPSDVKIRRRSVGRTPVPAPALRASPLRKGEGAARSGPGLTCPQPPFPRTREPQTPAARGAHRGETPCLT